MAAALSTALIVAPLAAQAPTPKPAAPPALRGVFEFGIEAGGDKIATVTFTNGSRQSVRAGQGGTLAAGLLWMPSPTVPLSLRGTVGFKFQTTAADDATIWLRRFPVELVASWHPTPDWRLGGGFVRHMRTRFTADNIVPDIPFPDATGATVELGWKVLALTYTAMEYTGASANAVGLTLIVPFGGR